MIVDDLIDRLLAGESARDLVDEVTMSGAIAGRPKPMGMIRKTREKKLKLTKQEIARFGSKGMGRK